MEPLRGRRGSTRALITKAVASLEILLEDPATPAIDLQMHLDLVLGKHRELRDLDQRIVEGIADEELDAELASDFEYNRKVSFVQTRVRLATPPAPGARRSDSPASSDLRPQGTSSVLPGPHCVALPKLQIPAFSADYRDWEGFWDHYHAAIHNNATLPKIEKFKYLRSYLTGKAKSATEGIRLADDNYDSAVQILTDRFGRRELLVDEHFDNLLALIPVRSSEDVVSLRVLYDDINFRINALEGLGYIC